MTKANDTYVHVDKQYLCRNESKTCEEGGQAAAAVQHVNLTDVHVQQSSLLTHVYAEAQRDISCHMIFLRIAAIRSP